MVDNGLFALLLVAALGCGLMAGFFFAFSACVMKALAQLPPREGIAAMQSINITVLNAWFLGTFLGTAVTCVLVIIASLWPWSGAQAIYACVGSALYLVGTLMVTMVCNVLKNNALAAVAPHDPNSASLWATYVTTWTAWNHVRTVAALAATAAFIMALCTHAAP